MAKKDTTLKQEEAGGPVKDAKGRFVKGHSGNPGGVSKEKAEIIALCKEHSTEAIETLVDLMRNAKGGHIRLEAALALLDRAYGKPSVSKDDDGFDLELLKSLVPQIIINTKDLTED